MNDLESSWRALWDRWEAVGGRDGLSHPERVWIDVRSLIDSIENGGLISYFYNSGADNIVACRAALQELDAGDVLMQLDRVAHLFGDPVPPLEVRNTIISSWPDDGVHDDFLRRVDDILMPKMAELETKLRSYLSSAGLVPSP